MRSVAAYYGRADAENSDFNQLGENVYVRSISTGDGSRLRNLLAQ